MGRSGDQQLAISRAIDSTLDQFDLARVKNRNVALAIRTLGQEESESAAVTGYLSNALRERIVIAGGRFVTSPPMCDIMLLLRIAVSGVDTTERDFTFEGLPLYALFVVKGYVRGTMVGYDRVSNEFFSLRPAEAIDERGKAFLFYLYGSEIRVSGKQDITEQAK